jgi:hypothetical protein
MSEFSYDLGQTGSAEWPADGEMYPGVVASRRQRKGLANEYLWHFDDGDKKWVFSQNVDKDVPKNAAVTVENSKQHSQLEPSAPKFELNCESESESSDPENEISEETASESSSGSG